ncbi:DMT family transporter [Rhodococcus aetherivorans]|uniref:DMT family transporter n=1 Tax=Rhodococcus aetherivorans TaxID=191292 RepID=UPI0035E51738
MADLTAHRSPASAVALVLAASALFGTTGTAQALGSRALGVPLDAVAVGAGRIVLAGTVLALFARARGPLFPAGRRLPTLLGAGGVVMYQLGFFTAVQTAGVAAGTMIALGSGPAFTGLLQWLVSRRRPGRVWAVSTAIAVVGLVVIVAGSGGGTSAGAGSVAAGALPALAAGLGYATYTVAGAALLGRGATPAASMGAMFGLAAVPMAAILLAQWPGGLDSAAGATTVVYLALVPTVLAYLLFALGLRTLSPAAVTTLTLAEPVVAAVLGVLVLGERLGPVALAGTVVVVAALTLLGRNLGGGVSAR